MSKKILLEYSPVRVQILAERIVDETTGKKEIDIKVKWQHAGIINSNKRRYRKEVLESEINRLQEHVKNREVFGCAYHPKDGIGKSTDVSHRWNKIWMNEYGICEGEITVLPTHVGQDVQVLVKSGKIGMSSRGFGGTTKIKETIGGKTIEFEDIDDGFELRSPGDFVMSPSVEGAGNYDEESEEIKGLENDLNEEIKMDKEFTIEQWKFLFNEAKMSGFKGTIEEFKKKMVKVTETFDKEFNEDRAMHKDKFISGR